MRSHIIALVLFITACDTAPTIPPNDVTVNTSGADVLESDLGLPSDTSSADTSSGPTTSPDVFTPAEVDVFFSSEPGSGEDDDDDDDDDDHGGHHGDDDDDDDD